MLFPKWEPVYSGRDSDQLSQIKNLLSNEGIPFRVKHLSGAGRMGTRLAPRIDSIQEQQEILVQEAHSARARELIQTLRP